MSRYRYLAKALDNEQESVMSTIENLEVTHHTVNANGIRQHYVEAGDGPPVVMLHGFPETHYAWRNQIPVLAQKYRVIAPDLRGYGETEKPASGYDKRTMANDLRALLKELSIVLRSSATIAVHVSRRGFRRTIRNWSIDSW
jgi:alpha-beta hydrolase superfamily lysophospholipase